MMRTGCILMVVFFTLTSASEPLAQDGSIPRTANGHPDLTGNYDAATLTPLERPAEYGDREADGIRK